MSRWVSVKDAMPEPWDKVRVWAENLQPLEWQSSEVDNGEYNGVLRGRR